MKAIYVGSIKSLGVKSLEVNGCNVSNIVYESTVLNDNAYFYVNHF